MKAIFNKLLLISFLLTLTGCATKTVVKEVPVYSTKTVYVSIPEILYKENKIPPPPNREVFINSTGEDREDLLTKYSLSLMKEIKACNADKRSIGELIQGQESLVKDKEKKE